MGSVSFCKTVIAENASDAFEELVDEAREDYGRNRYNGTISTCSMGRLRRSFDVYNKKNAKEAYDYISANNNGAKGVADYIDMGVKHYVICETKTTPHKADAKFCTKYVLYGDDGPLRPSNKYTFDDYSAAKKAANEEAVVRRQDISVEKIPVKQSGTTTKCRVTVTERIVEKKPKSSKKGQRIVPMHVFCFYGWAAE